MDEDRLNQDARLAFVCLLHQSDAVVVQAIDVRLDAITEIGVLGFEVWICLGLERWAKCLLCLDQCCCNLLDFHRVYLSWVVVGETNHTP